MNKVMIAAALLAVPGLASAKAMTGAQYVAKAGASDMYEMQSSRLVLATSKNANLRAFANEMIKDHTQSTADVKAAAKAGKVVAGPPHLDAMGMKNVAALKAKTGPARDALYVQQQKTSHQMALQLQQDYAANGTVAPLKAAATKIVPVVQHHIGELQKM